jgi:type I restriction enzyme S subunit
MSEEATLDEFMEQDQNVENDSQKVRLGPVNASFPNDWDVGSMESLYKEKSIGTNERGTEKDETVPLVKMGDIERKKTAVTNIEEKIERTDTLLDEYRLERGDFLFNTRNTPDLVGKTAVWGSDIPAVYDNNILCVRFKSDVSSLFVNYFLSAGIGWRQARGHVHGTTSVAAIYDSEFDKIQIPLPKVGEQHKIATVLYNVDQAIQKTEEVISQLDQVKQGLYQILFSEGYRNHDQFKSSKYGQIPESWHVSKLTEISSQIQAGGTPDTDEPEYYGGDIPWVKTGELSQYRVTETEENITEQGFEESTARLFSPGTILIAMYGATTGEVSLLDIEATTNQACCGIVATDEVKPEFLFHQLNYLSNHLKSLSAGSGQQNISKGIIEKFDVLVPTVEEQCSILSVLNSVDKSISENESTKKQYQRLKQGLMQDLLSGKVRTTDTNIEVPEHIRQHG